MDNTTMFLRFEGRDGVTTIVEETGKTVNNTDVQLDDGQVYGVGDSSGQFNGSSSSLEIENANGDLNIGTGDFTIEFRFRQNNFLVTQTIFDFRTAYSQVVPCLYFNASTNRLNYFVSGSVRLFSSSTISADTWYHVELSRHNNYTRLFINGVLEDEMDDDYDYIDVDSILLGINYAGSTKLNGRISHFRISNIARHITDFDPDWLLPKYNRTSSSYYNKRDVDRVNANIQFLNDFINDYLGTSRTLPDTYTAPDKKTFGKASFLNKIENNINSIRDYLGYDPTNWNTLSASWVGDAYDFIYTDANALEEDLKLIEQALLNIKSTLDYYKIGNPRLICGGGFPVF